jgi:uncharacterized membrane protein
MGCGLMAGVFFAFSAFVMRGLAQLPPSQGLSAMQALNRAAINPLFLALFLGTAVACFLLAISALLQWQRPGAVFLLVGGLLYFSGAFLVTAVFNVPMNNALATVDPASTDAARHWSGYLRNWTAWNHVRTATALLATVALTFALLQARA